MPHVHGQVAFIIFLLSLHFINIEIVDYDSMYNPPPISKNIGYTYAVQYISVENMG